MRKEGDSPNYVVVRAPGPPSSLGHHRQRTVSKSQPDSASQVEIKTLHASLKRLVLQSKNPLCLGQRSRIPFFFSPSSFPHDLGQPSHPSSPPISEPVCSSHSASPTTKLSSHPVIYRKRSRDTLLRRPNLPTHAYTPTYRSYRSHSFIHKTS
ncbi:hypothetical protein VTG60DRAFT_3247 [Thermothelomyces hinnuleus]